jgi:hypothetical protein
MCSNPVKTEFHEVMKSHEISLKHGLMKFHGKFHGKCHGIFITSWNFHEISWKISSLHGMIFASEITPISYYKTDPPLALAMRCTASRMAQFWAVSMVSTDGKA